MPTEIIMPKVDMDMTSGRIIDWHVAEGALVEQGQPLFDIETDKTAMEVESPARGYLHHRVSAGETIAIGEPVGWLYADGEAVDRPSVQSAIAAIKSDLAEPTVTPLAIQSSQPEIPSKPRATPVARRLARDRGVELAAITGSALGGRITRADVEAQLEAGIPPASDPSTLTAELSITRSGSGTATPLVMIHGLANCSLGWAKLEALLPKGYPLIKLDLPCHGRSPLTVPADFRALVSTVRRCLDELELGQAHLLGHSLGGAIAMALADTRPRMIKSLTLLSPAGLGPDINGTILQGLLRATKPESLGPWLEQLVADPDLITPAYTRLAMAARAEPSLRAAQLAFADKLLPDGTQSMDLKAALARAQVPTRIIFGRADKVIPWRHALAAPGRVSLNLFDHVGHLPHVERPEDVADLLQTILD